MNINVSSLIYGIAILAACLLLRDKVPYVGRLPGDFYFNLGSVQFFAPLVSMLVMHFIVSLVRGLFK